MVVVPSIIANIFDSKSGKKDDRPIMELSNSIVSTSSTPSTSSAISKPSTSSTPSTPSNPYNCGHCKKFSHFSMDEMTKHHNTAHPFKKQLISIEKLLHESAALVKKSPIKPQKVLPVGTDIIYICYHCIHKSNNVNELYHHWMLSHKKPKMALNNVTFPGRPFWFKITKFVVCFYCPKTDTHHNIRLHNSRAHSREPFITLDACDISKCGECNFRFTSDRNDMIEHYITEHGIYTIQEPNRYLTDEFIEKLLIHGHSGKHTCLHCQTIFNYKEDFLDHQIVEHPDTTELVNITRDPISYGCPECRYMDDDELNMIKHMRKHCPIYQCNFCDKTFKYIKMLRQHHEIMHKAKYATYRNVDVEPNLSFYLTMKIILPNGWIMTKGEAGQTKYGKVDEIKAYIVQLNEEELVQFIEDQKTEQANEVMAVKQLNDALKKTKAGYHSRTSSLPKTTKNNKRTITNKNEEDEDSDATTASTRSSELMYGKKRTKKSLKQPLSDNENDIDFEPKKSKKPVKRLASYNDDEPPAKLAKTEFSFYGKKPDVVDFSKVYTTMSVGGNEIKVSCDKFATLMVNINPTLKLHCLDANEIKQLKAQCMLKK